MDKPQLRLITEVNRVARLAFAHQPPIDPDAAWELLRTEPVKAEDRPGFVQRLWPPRLIHHPWGDGVRLQRDAFFATALVPFTAIALRDGMTAVAFRAMVRQDFAPVVLRFAVDRLFAANTWRFPEDLVNGLAFSAILELAFSGDPASLFQPRDEKASGSTGELALVRLRRAERQPDSFTLRWTPRTLAFHSERTGIF